MSRRATQLLLVRHGETEWSRLGRHTGRTDLALTEEGRSQARRLAPALSRWTFAKVLTSPLLRARETCDLAGLGERAEVRADLVEWNYGDLEGLTHGEIEAPGPRHGPSAPPTSSSGPPAISRAPRAKSSPPATRGGSSGGTAAPVASRP